MDILKDLNANAMITEGSAEEEEVITREIRNALRSTGIDPDSDDGKIEMAMWRNRRNRNPGLYRKFVGDD